MKTEINNQVIQYTNDDGAKWTCRDPVQAAKHLPTWIDQGMPLGDTAAIKDCVEAFKTQAPKIRPSFSWKYINGEAIPVIVKGEKV